MFRPIVLADYNHDPVTRLCWIEAFESTPLGYRIDLKGVVIQVALFYFPLFLGLLINFYIYWRAITVTETILTFERELRAIYIRKLRLFPLALLFAFVPECFYRLYTILTLQQEIWYLTLASNCFGALIGFFNALVYGSEIVAIMKEDSLCPCFNSPIEEEEAPPEPPKPQVHRPSVIEMSSWDQSDPYQYPDSRRVSMQYPA